MAIIAPLKCCSIDVGMIGKREYDSDGKENHTKKSMTDGELLAPPYRQADERDEE